MVASGWNPVAFGKVMLTLEETLEQIKMSNPGSRMQTETRYLTQSQLQEARSAAGVEVPSALVVRKVLISSSGKTLEFIYTDTHRVRTHPETLLLRVGPDQELKRIEVLSFDEPMEYLPKPLWFGTFQNKKLTPELEIKGGIPMVTGASLSARSVVEASRRILAIHKVLEGTHRP